MTEPATDPESQIAVIKEFFDAATLEALESVLDDAKPGVVVDLSKMRSPLAGVYEGREVLELWRNFIDAWDQIEFFHDEFIPIENGIVRVGGLRSRGRGSGVEVAARVAQVFEFEDGRLARMTFYQDKREALAALSHAADSS